MSTLSPEDKKRRTRKRLKIGGVVVLVFWIIGALAPSKPAVEPVAAEPVPAAPAKPEYCIQTGQVCQLTHVPVFNKDTTWIPVAVSLEAYQEFHKAIRADDIDGIYRLFLTGDVLHTEAGDGIRVLETSVFSGYTEGRLTSGKHQGAKVWTTMQWVVPTP